jgi:hypothetical protein
VLKNSVDKDLLAEFRRFLDHACVIFQVPNLAMQISRALSLDDTDSDSNGY